MAVSKRVTFKNNNAYGCDHNMGQQAYSILNHFFPDPDDEKAPTNIREFVQFLQDTVQKLGMDDTVQRYRKAVDDVHDLEKKVDKLTEKNTTLSSELEALKGDKSKVEADFKNHQNNPKVIVLDDESYSDLEPFFEKFSQADPEATRAQALACLPDALKSVQKETGSRGFRLSNGKVLSLK